MKRMYIQPETFVTGFTLVNTLLTVSGTASSRTITNGGNVSEIPEGATEAW